MVCRIEKGGTALGGSYDWKPLPRIPKPCSLDSAEYKNIAAEYLRTRRVSQPVLNLTQAVRNDLDGDKQDEVLLTATRIVPFAEKDQSKGYDEYSIVLLRKVLN